MRSENSVASVTSCSNSENQTHTHLREHFGAQAKPHNSCTRVHGHGPDTASGLVGVLDLGVEAALGGA